MMTILRLSIGEMIEMKLLGSRRSCGVVPRDAIIVADMDERSWHRGVSMIVSRNFSSALILLFI